MPEEGLLKFLDEKYLRQQVEDVDGHMVPKTLAPVLKLLLHKYGDLGGWDFLSSAMKSIPSTLLCVVLEKMCKTKVEDVTRDDLKHILFCLTGIEKISGFKIRRFYRDWLDSGFPLKAFLGFEAIRNEEETCKNLKNKIITLKAELEKCEKNLDKLETQRSQMSDYTNYLSHEKELLNPNPSQSYNTTYQEHSLCGKHMIIKPGLFKDDIFLLSQTSDANSINIPKLCKKFADEIVTVKYHVRDC